MPELELSTIASSPGPLAEIRLALDESEFRPHWHVNVHTPCLSEARPPSPSSRRLTSTSTFGFARQLFFYGQRSDSVVSLQQVASIYPHGGDSLLLQKLRTIEKSTYQQ